MDDPPAAAGFVVVGGGVHGLSTAYHLAEAGVDVVLLEKRHLGAGASGICGGIVRNYYLSAAMNEIVRQSLGIFELDREGFGLRQVGYVAAVGEEQAVELELIARQHEEIGYESTIAGPGHLRALFPDWRADGVAAVLHERRGGWADPNATVSSLAGMARAVGVRVVEGAEVVAFDLDGEAVRSVETTRGSIACDVVVVAPGPWAREVLRLLGLDSTAALLSYLKVREGDYRLPDRYPARAPVVHLDLHEPLRSDRDGRVLDPGPWGIYFRGNGHGGVQAGGLPERLDAECELDPYGPAHPEHGRTTPAFDEWLTSGLAASLGRFAGRSGEWRCASYGAQVAFTPDAYPIVDFVRPNAYAILDSNHGFKLLALGRLAAAEILGEERPELQPFRLDRFAAAALHPASSSPYPWT